jgi:cytochrome c oxidase assembly factor CtaG
MSAVPPTFSHLLGSWRIDPAFVVVLTATAALYVWGLLRLSGRWPVWRAISFLCGLLTLGVALMSGVDSLADELLSVHMVQHLLLVLLAPALLVCGAPVRLALAAGSHSSRSVLATLLSSGLVRLLTRPAVGFALFAAVMLATHLTGLFELALEDQTVHAFEHAAYFWVGVLLLAPLIAADPLPHAPGAVTRFCWLMGAMTTMAVPGALLTFSEDVRYPFYLAPARELGRSALADQHLAGAIMWVGGGVAMFALALCVTMGAMLAEERRERRRELYIDDRDAFAKARDASAQQDARRIGALGA